MAKSRYSDRRGDNNANWRGGFESSCNQCGAAVWVRPSTARRKTRFCSKDCHSRWMSANTRKEKASGWRGGADIAGCQNCGTKFYVSKSEKARGGGLFCSPDCFQKNKKNKRVLINCEQCSEPFDVPLHRAENAKFCSRTCKHSSLRKERTEGDIVKRRLDLRISSLMWYSLRHGRGKGGNSWKSLVPYTVDELRKHLAKTMPTGYTWTDFVNGDLEVDHKIPRSAYNYTSPEDYDFKRCWALDNLQLLTARENMSKGAKLSAPFQPTLL